MNWRTKRQSAGTSARKHLAKRSSLILLAMGFLLPNVSFGQFVDWSVRHQADAPTLGPNAGASVLNLGDGWYRARIEADPAATYSVLVEYAVNAPPAAVIDLEFTDSLANVVTRVARNGTFRLGSHPVNAPYTIDLEQFINGVFDSDRRNLATPQAEVALQYFFDVGNDGDFEVTGSGQGMIDFFVPPGTALVNLAGFVRHPGGLSEPFLEALVLDNQPPDFQEARLLSQDENDFSVVIGLGAQDSDGDQISYRIEWGDGQETITASSVASHDYANAFAPYRMRITADDGRGGQTVRFIDVSFDAPPPNNQPTFEHVRLLDQDGLNVVVTASATDIDGDFLTYVYDWGDGTAPTISEGIVQSHTYPVGTIGPRIIDVSVADGRGGLATDSIQVIFAAPENNLAPSLDGIHLVERNGFDVAIGLQASDPNGDPLIFEVDWNDGSPVENIAGPFVNHSFPLGQFQPYRIGVVVRDGRGGSDSDHIDVVFSAPDANTQPVMETVRTANQDNFRVTLVATAADDDDDLLAYRFDWGDGSPDTTNAGGTATHEYAAVFQPYQVNVTVEDGRGGSDSVIHPVVFQAPQANRAPAINLADVIRQDGFTVAVAVGATDSDGDVISYGIDWGDGSALTENLAGVGQHVYADNVFGAYDITVHAEDGRGGADSVTLQVEFVEPPPNTPPEIEVAEIVRQEGFSITLAIGAHDADNDQLTYNITWGDGQSTFSQGGVVTHDYPAGVYRIYNPSVLVQDGRGGFDEVRLDITFQQPPNNQQPTIDQAEIINQDGFFVVVGAHAIDTDGDPITYRFDWGDGSPATVQGNGIAAHRFPNQFVPYVMTVTATDGQGGAAIANINVEFTPPPANIAPVIVFSQVLERRGRHLTVAVSASDDDGDSLTYTFDWGDGSPPEATGGGVASHDYAADVVGLVTARVIVSDGRGGEVQGDFDFNFPLPGPNQPPVFEVVQLVEQVDFEVVVAVNAVDADGDTLDYTFDWGDGSVPTTSLGGVAHHTYPNQLGETYNIVVTVTDGQGGEDTEQLSVDYPEPAPNQAPVFDLASEIDRDGLRVTFAVSAVDPDGDPVNYVYDWHDGSAPTATAGGVVTHAFPDYGHYLVVVQAQDGRGGSSDVPILVEINAPPPNIAPTIESIGLLRQGDWHVTAAIGAHDEDGDELTFTLDWGDGDDTESNHDGIAAHDFPVDMYRTYTVQVTVTDGRGGEANGSADVDFPHPPENQAPLVNEVAVEVGPRGQVSIVVATHDAEGHALSHGVHWGDEADENVVNDLPGGNGSHTYPLPANGEAYTGYVDVTDALGEVTRAPFAVLIADQPTMLRSVSTDMINNGTVRFTVTATDGDGAAFLTYGFDFEDDGNFEIVDAASFTALHHYDVPGVHRFRIRVTDSWSGATTEQEGVVNLAPWIPENTTPEIVDISVTTGVRGHVAIRIQSHDADGDIRQHFVHWGDEDQENIEVDAIDGHAQHAYAYRVDMRAYEGYVRVVDSNGAETRATFDVEIPDAPMDIHDLTIVDVGSGQYEARVTAHDADAEADLSYSYDFNGNGDWEIEDSPAAHARYQFAAPGDYRMRIRVVDSWSGTGQIQVRDLTVNPWVPENHAPILDGFEVTVGPGGHALVRVAAHDPEGEPLETFVRWGDEADLGSDASFLGDSTRHTYAYRAPNWHYSGNIRLRDAEGVETNHPFTVQVVDTPTQIRRFESERIREGTWLMRTDAIDPDSPDGLTYSFDFDSDGVWDLRNAPGPQVVHTFDSVGRHPVRIGVTDPWSGVVADSVFVVGDDREGTPNLPPEILSIAVDVAPGGHAKLRVDASDPEGGELTIQVDWGDGGNHSLDTVIGGEAAHRYSFPANGLQYDGQLRITDQAGLTIQHDFAVDVTDHATRIDQIALTVLRNGTVFVAVSAIDPDSDSLEYAFDMNGDDLFEASDLHLGEYLHEYAGGGTYEVIVSITDPWSGTVTEAEQVFVLEPWLRSAPFADDHLEGEEGRCLVLRVAQGRVTSETGPSVCEREQNPNADDWRWDFGDGTVSRGSEVGHVYADNGIYSVTVSGGNTSQPIESVIEILVVNVAPQFVTTPPEYAEGGTTYFYTVELTDQGVEDEVKLDLTDGPAGMTLDPLGGRKWQLSWDVPPETEGIIEVELTTTDGRTVDGMWRPDGGRTVQRYRLTVEPLIIPDAALPEPDAYVPSFRDITGDKLGCDATAGGSSPMVLLSLLCLLGIVRRRTYRG